MRTETMPEYTNSQIREIISEYIHSEIYPREDKPEPLPSYSYAAPPEAETIKEYGDTPFLQAIAGRNPDEIWPIMDEVMTALMALNRRLYDAAMRKLQ